MRISIAAVLTIGLSFSTLSFANNARDLLDQDCTKCHTDNVYKRANHKVKDLKGLRKQVDFCMGPGNAKWFDDETEEVVQYLNKNFYKF